MRMRGGGREKGGGMVRVSDRHQSSGRKKDSDLQRISNRPPVTPLASAHVHQAYTFSARSTHPTPIVMPSYQTYTYIVRRIHATTAVLARRRLVVVVVVTHGVSPDACAWDVYA